MCSIEQENSDSGGWQASPEFNRGVVAVGPSIATGLTQSKPAKKEPGKGSLGCY